MFSHPAAVLGFILAGIGWLMLLFGAGSSEVLGRQVVNFHSIWIAQSAIVMGGLFIVGGVVAGAADHIRQALLFHPEIAAGDRAFRKKEKVRKKQEAEYRMTGKKPAPVSDEELEDAERRLDELAKSH